MDVRTLVSEKPKTPLNWDIQLNFDPPKVVKEEVTPAPAPVKITPRQLIAEKYPKILERIELMWCSLELHNYLGQILFTERANRQGFPKEVMQALSEIYSEHKRELQLKKMLSEDVWDV